MAAKGEVEIKFRIGSIPSLARRLKASGFRLLTRRTLETNPLYDFPGGVLRRRGALLRLRKYGPLWTVTYKEKGKLGRHKSRREIETRLSDGLHLAAIFDALGLGPSFSY